MIAGSLLVLGLLVTFVKHAHFQLLKSNAAAKLGQKLGLDEEHFSGVEWSVELKAVEEQLVPPGIRGILVKRSAIAWLVRSLYLVTLMNLLIVVQSIVACIQIAGCRPLLP